MELSRRKALALSTAALVTPRLAFGAPQQPVFSHGVASGDPDDRSVVLWTRAVPKQGTGTVQVNWAIYKDPKLRKRQARGKTTTAGERDWTVNVVAGGLKPRRTYYYQFTSQGEKSVTGRTRTLPATGVTQVRLAFASCSNLPFGYFNSYRHIAARNDLDVVLHLGDYIYEYGNDTYAPEKRIGRNVVPDREITSLADYRARYAQYRSDPDLAELHRQQAMIAVWDDHESANNAWRYGAENHDRVREGAWETRRLAAFQAWTEWLPVRPAVRTAGYIWRKFALGDLVDLTMLDTRIYGRDREAASPQDKARLSDPTRSLLGTDQEAWLLQNLSASKQRGTRWQVLGQQIMFGQLGGFPDMPILNPDQWDGYPFARQRILDYLAKQKIDNVAILTGDIHSSWGQDISPNPFDETVYNGDTGKGSLAVEFVATSITSPGVTGEAEAAANIKQLRATHPHMKYIDLLNKGYVLLDITPDRMQGEYWHADSILKPGAGEHLATTLMATNRANHLVPGGPASSAPDQREPA